MKSSLYIGCRVEVCWMKDEIGDTVWRPGWYNAEVQAATIECDEITVVYTSKPEHYTSDTNVVG